jgi:hypothetical protein
MSMAELPSSEIQQQQIEARNASWGLRSNAGIAEFTPSSCVIWSAESGSHDREAHQLGNNGPTTP